MKKSKLRKLIIAGLGATALLLAIAGATAVTAPKISLDSPASLPSDI